MHETRTAIVADDEPTLRDYLIKQLGIVWPELKVVGTAGSGREALKQIEDLKPDVAFLDIKMPGMSGIEVAGQITSPTRLVFVTAFDEFAVEAFEKAAVDYLLKPVDEKRLRQSVNRLTERLSEPASEFDVAALAESLASLTGKSPQYLNWIRVGHQGETRILQVDDVAYFKADQKYTSVRTLQAEHLIRKSIKDLEVELDPKKFWRIHRSTLVNLAYIEVAKRDFRGRFTLHLKGLRHTLKVSDTYSHLFRQM